MCACISVRTHNTPIWLFDCSTRQQPVLRSTTGNLTLASTPMMLVPTNQNMGTYHIFEYHRLPDLSVQEYNLYQYLFYVYDGYTFHRHMYSNTFFVSGESWIVQIGNWNGLMKALVTDSVLQIQFPRQCTHIYTRTCVFLKMVNTTSTVHAR